MAKKSIRGKLKFWRGDYNDGGIMAYFTVSSGSSANEVIPICQEYPFVKEVIIFCGNYEKHKHYIKDYEN